LRIKTGQHRLIDEPVKR